MIPALDASVWDRRDTVTKEAKTVEDVVAVRTKYASMKKPMLCATLGAVPRILRNPDVASTPMNFVLSPTTEITYDSEGNGYLGSNRLSRYAEKILLETHGRFLGNKVSSDEGLAARTVMFRHARDYFLTKFTNPTLYFSGHEEEGVRVFDMLGFGDVHPRDLAAVAEEIEKVLPEGTDVILRGKMARPVTCLILDYVLPAKADAGGNLLQENRTFIRVRVQADWKKTQLWVGSMDARNLSAVSRPVDLADNHATEILVTKAQEALEAFPAWLEARQDIFMGHWDSVGPWRKHPIWMELFRLGWSLDDYHGVTDWLAVAGFNASGLVPGSTVIPLVRAWPSTRPSAASWKLEAALLSGLYGSESHA